MMDTTCKVVIVDGLIYCGRSTLTHAIAEDLEIDAIYNGLQSVDTYKHLRLQLEAPPPLIIDTFHLTAAAAMRGSGPMPNDLTPEQWQLLDDAVARRFGRIIYLVDTPGRVEERLKADRSTWTRERLGMRLQHLNQAFAASSVARKSSYVLTQFMDPKTGEKTTQYKRLLNVIREEMNLQ